MTADARHLPDRSALPELVATRTFDAIVVDWDSTAVPDEGTDLAPLRDAIESLCAAGVCVIVVSGAPVEHVDGRLHARPKAGAGGLFLCVDDGAEVHQVTSDGPALVQRRTALPDEDTALDAAAARTVEWLAARGIAARVSTHRNRRSIDLVAEPGPTDPHSDRLTEPLVAVTARLATAGIAGLAEVVSTAIGAARDAGIEAARVTADVTRVDIGLTDASDAARWAAAHLATLGITGGLVLVAGDRFGPTGGVPGRDSLLLVPELARAIAVSVGTEPGGVLSGVVHLGGGAASFAALLDAQLTRRAEHRVPWIDEDPAWVLPLPTEPDRQRIADALGCLSNGWVGVRGDGDETAPLFVVSGVYVGDDQRLLPGPVWTGVRTAGTAEVPRRLLDLRTGVLVATRSDGLRALRFVSAADPHALVQRTEGPPERLLGAAPLSEPAGVDGFEHRQDGAAQLARTGRPPGPTIAVAARDLDTTTTDGVRVVERLAAWDANRDDGWETVRDRLAGLERVGVDHLLARHRVAWADRWRDALVTIEGSPDDELAARFAVFQLIGAAPDAGEAAVGARGLTGMAYGGHVFWDADVFVLPALAAIRPSAARAMLEYRIRRLPAARAAAASRGRAGARFPWESAADGTDVTPTHAYGRHGEVVPILTGEHEVHIVADVAWAAAEYAAWSGDRTFLTGPGRDLLIETARYWASRARRDEHGRAHLDGVMGPDEYHEAVDDNAYTNAMARWNLRRAAELVEASGGDRAEARAWRELADALVDGYDADRGLHEQFAGYWDLEPLTIDAVAEPPVTADVLLGPARVAGSQIIKQADVLMAHHLVPDELAPGSLAADLAFYETRTAHGSSLSPAIHAALWARAGHPERALHLFRLAARLDLDDLTGTTAGGLHLATCGGVWQALAYGFLGLRPSEDGLVVDPHLPSAWQSLTLRFRFHGAAVEIRADHETVTIACSQPITVRIAGGDPHRCEPPARTFLTKGSRA